MGVSEACRSRLKFDRLSSIEQIERAWDGRHNPRAPASPEDLKGNLEFIQFTLQSTAQMVTLTREDPSIL